MIVKYWFQLLRWLTFTYITMNHPSWKPLPRKIVELLKNSTTPADSSMISPRSITMDTCSNSKKGFTQKELVLNKEYKEDNRALIHEAGLVIQAPKPVCQFMAEDIPPSILNPYPTTSINSTSHKVPSQPSSQD